MDERNEKCDDEESKFEKDEELGDDTPLKNGELNDTADTPGTKDDVDKPDATISVDEVNDETERYGDLTQYNENKLCVNQDTIQGKNYLHINIWSVF